MHDLRKRLRKKMFGLMGGDEPAHALADCVAKPAASATWKAVQKVAHANALIYQRAFPFLAQVDGEPSSIWPTWDSDTRALKFHMPFNERFWRADEILDECLTWQAKSRARESVPLGLQGYIVALTDSWTRGENNLSGMNLSMFANVPPRKSDTIVADRSENNSTSTRV